VKFPKITGMLAMRDALDNNSRDTGRTVSALQAVTQYLHATKLLGDRPVSEAVECYGLTRDQYGHVLSTFSHSGYEDAPRQCLAAFDELQKMGFEAFTKKHDLYWDIPLNENLPQLVIDLPIPDLPPTPRPAAIH
jgi:hypothetical protein